jgi:hypothetical protein
VLSQKRCLESKNIPSVIEVMPAPNVSKMELVMRLNSEFTPVDLGIRENEVLTLSCIVNCLGESFNFRAEGVNTPEMAMKVKGLFYDLTWRPGLQRGIPVDCRSSCSFKVMDGEFVLLTDRVALSRRKRGLP